MKTSVRTLVGLLVSALMLAGVAANQATAQEKGTASMTVLAENDKARAFEIRFKPGDENASVPSSNWRVARALQGGTQLRTYPDGKTEKVEWKAGEVRIVGPAGAYTTKNIGKGDLVLYVVVLK
ncbi:MAG TPA: hypothetical protein VML91_15895 [Burkholderiales bacterium]|nr:hypothetical protein [Burkholderiales bacterium]